MFRRHHAPLIFRYSATNVPILQASSGEVLNEAQLFDLAPTSCAAASRPCRGADPWPYGGKVKQ